MHNTLENIKWRATGSFTDENYVFSGFSFEGADLEANAEIALTMHGSLIKQGSIAAEQTADKEPDKGVHDSF